MPLKYVNLTGKTIVISYFSTTYIRCTWQYHNETIFHLLIIFYCKDLNFFTFTNFANCSNIEFDYAMYIGQRATACAAVDSNNESTRASVFWIYSHRIYWYHLHTYVNELADAYMGENTYMQMPKQIQMHSLASAKVRWMCIYIRTPKICKCKSNIATHMPLPWLVVCIRQASPVGCLVRICLQFIRASIHGKKNELNTEIYRNLVFSSEGIKG